jgi:hypothetical protein
LIEVGDTIKVPKNGDKAVVVGPVCVIHSDSQMCTGKVMYFVLGGTEQDYFNAKDAEIILKRSGAEPNDGPPSTVPAAEERKCCR